jgi:Capsule polysaccharide biosynthesis protein
MKTILKKIRSLASNVGKPSAELEVEPIFAVRHDTASVTNYDKLYAQNYYAHQSDSTSYDIERFPRLLRKLAGELGVNSLLDIGGGNGKLSQIWRDSGGKAASLDYYDNPEAYCKKFDLSRNDDKTSSEVASFLSTSLGRAWISTCLDVAEHIDNEHLADFMFNLKGITGKALVISISTRPSSQANSFHSTVIPIETWKKIFLASGFEIYSDSYFDELVRDVHFVGTGTDIISVSHWHKINPFRDTKNHQHYLIVRNNPRIKTSSVPILRRKLADILDISYRWDKRALDREYPMLTYSVHFVQDWAFARSIMDAWPADRFRITLREDCISKSYQKVIKGFLTQKGIDFTTLHTSHEASLLLSPPLQAGDMWMTATEGNRSVTHQLNSLVMMKAREAGYHTVSLQHGMTIASSLAPASELIGVWDKSAKDAFLAAITEPMGHSVEVLGSPKSSDATFGQQSDAIENRFGNWTSHFKNKILIALNLHWSVHQHGTTDTYSWIERLINNNPDCLFFLKPHPDDSSIYDFVSNKPYSNIILIDDILLISMDWSLMRLLKAIDGVITSQSTLILDALVAGTPIVRLPVIEEKALGNGLTNASFPYDTISAIPMITDEEWSHGAIPSALTTLRLKLPANRANDDCFFSRLITLNNNWTSLDLQSAKAAIESAMSQAMLHVNLSQNPHKDIHALDAAMARFLN